MTPMIIAAVVVIGAQSGGAHDVQLGPETYRIPDAYGVSVRQRQADYAAMTLDLVLPDLAPASSDPAETSHWGNGTGWHKQMHILVEYSSKPSNPDFQQRMLNHAFDDAELEKQFPALGPFLSRDNFTIQPNGCRVYSSDYIVGDVLQTCGDGPHFSSLRARPK
jgi:hypothetical protein